MRSLSASVLFVLAAIATGPSWGMDFAVQRQAAPAADVALGRRVVAPFPAVMFCHQHPESCDVVTSQIVTSASGRVALSAQIAARIRAVNEIVNRTIIPTPDQGADEWKITYQAGDCVDFALTKRELLIRTGFPSSAALIAIARVANGEEHAVLVIRTDQGALVLDNLGREIRPWSSVAYRWEKIQSPENPRVWVKLSS